MTDYECQFTNQVQQLLNSIIMKKLGILIVLLISLVTETAVWAADSASGVLPADGTVYVYEQSIENTWVDESDEARFIANKFSCTVVGDETIDGIVYKKILYQNLSQNLPEELLQPKSEVIYIVERSGVIFRHAGSDYPLIDFNHSIFTAAS